MTLVTLMTRDIGPEQMTHTCVCSEESGPCRPVGFGLSYGTTQRFLSLALSSTQETLLVVKGILTC